jgi:hypothetical protein
MPTDPTEAARPTKLAGCDGGFTQTWDTVGAGTTSHAERAWLRGAHRSAVKLSVRLRGKQSPATKKSMENRPQI